MKPSYILDEYEKEFVGINLLSYSKYVGQWFYHDYYSRLQTLTKLIFPFPKKHERGLYVPPLKRGFAFIVPMTMAIVINNRKEDKK